MSPPRRRRRRQDYRPPRNRREVAVAVLCALGVLVVTVALLFVLRPRDEGADTPPVSIPLPEESLPTDSVPPDTAAATTAPPDSTAAPAP